MASSNLTPLFVKGIKEHFYVEVDAVKTVYDEIFRVKPTDTRYVQVQQWQTPGAPQRRQGGEAVAQSSFLPSFSKQYIVVNYALGDTIFKEDILDDLYGIIHRVLPQRGGALAESFRTLKERLAANFFKNYGWASGSSVTGMVDGKSLFNTAHPVSLANSNLTFSNRPSTDIDLSIAAVQAARANIVAQPAPNNYAYLDNALDLCVVHPNLHQVAVQVFSGPLERGTGDNNRNTLVSDNVRVIEWPYFQSSGTVGSTYSPAAYNSWFVLGKKHKLEWWQRNDLAVESDYVINVLSQVYVAYERFTYGASDWRGTYGSLGN